MFVIVPNYVSEAIYKKIDEALEKYPSLVKDREDIYGQLLDHYNKTGRVPEFSLELKDPAPSKADEEDK